LPSGSINRDIEQLTANSLPAQKLFSAARTAGSLGAPQTISVVWKSDRLTVISPLQPAGKHHLVRRHSWPPDSARHFSRAQLSVATGLSPRQYHVPSSAWAKPMPSTACAPAGHSIIAPVTIATTGRFNGKRLSGRFNCRFLSEICAELHSIIFDLTRPLA